MAVALSLACWSSAGNAAELAQQSAGQIYEDAVALRRQGDAVAAITRLKEGLQLDPRHLPSLFLRGEVYLDAGLADIAETSFLAALASGADRAQAIPLLGEALLIQHLEERVLAEIRTDGLDPPARVHVHALRGEAHYRLGNHEAANGELEESERLDPNALKPAIVRINMRLRERAFSEAGALADRMLDRYPLRGEAWASAATVAHVTGNLELALERYTKSIELDAHHAESRVARIGLLIDLDRDQQAESDLEYFATRGWSDPRVHYLRAVKLARAGDAIGTSAALQNAIDLISTLDKEFLARDPQMTLLGALAYFGLRNPQQAESYLRRYLDRVPSDMGARQLIAYVFLESEQPLEAIEFLEPALTARRSVESLTLMARAQSMRGNLARAASLLEEARGLRPGNAIETRLARVYIGAGNVDQGIGLLESIVAGEGGNSGVVAAATSLIVTYQRVGQIADARKLAASMAKQYPGELTFLNLLGVSDFMSGDLSAAAEHFSACLRINADFLPAAINAARTQRAAGRFAEARTALQQLLLRHPGHARIEHELSLLEQLLGNREDALKHAERAWGKSSEAADMLAHLVDLYLERNDKTRALEVVNNAVGLHPERKEFLEALASVQLRLGTLEDARSTLKRLVKAAGEDPAWLLRAASLQSDARSPAEAESTLNFALHVDADNLNARLGLVEQLLALRQQDKALAAANELVRRHPREGRAYLLLGEALAAAGETDAALAAFDTAVSIGELGLAVIRGSHVLASAGRAPAARARLQRWVREHPDDGPVARTLAEYLMLTGELGAARDAYAGLLERAPADVQLLNNQANVLHRLNDERAEQMAREAHRLAPTSPSVNDTLGWILTTGGRAADGLPFLREAVTRTSSDPSFRFHLAACLEQLGRLDEAKTELAAALQQGSFEDTDKALELQARLRDRS